MKKYKVYECEQKQTSTRKFLKKLVLQGEGDKYPLKNVTMWENHPLFAEIAVGQTVELEIEEKDGAPNPHGGFYKNRTAIAPAHTTKQETSTPQGTSSRADNLIEFKVLPALDKIYRELVAISGRQERQMGLDPRAIDEAMGASSEDSPF